MNPEAYTRSYFGKGYIEIGSVTPTSNYKSTIALGITAAIAVVAVTLLCLHHPFIAIPLFTGGLMTGITALCLMQSTNTTKEDESNLFKMARSLYTTSQQEENNHCSLSAALA